MSKKPDRRLIFSVVLIFLAIPLTIAFGMSVLHDRRYYFVSVAILIYTMLPFLLSFEHRRPKAREVILICSLSAISVIGRAAFFMIPEFKPVAAIVIIAGICLGPESGFLVGALSGFVSNFFFGQGAWTPWQMFSFGIIGFLAGFLHQRGILNENRAVLCVFGGLSTFVIYGGLMNLSSALTVSPGFGQDVFWATFLAGIPFDLVHAASTVIFLFFIAKPMTEKLIRIRVKYGLMEDEDSSAQ